MDTWRSDYTDDNDGEVIEITPIEEYDKQKAKARASLSWILCKAYQGKVPVEFTDPFYDTAEGKWQIKPRLANLLASSEIYCLACRYMFGENSSQWTGHWSIIQVLSRKGIYAVGNGSVDVTETILMQSAPFKIKAHLALIDALMTALAREIAPIERVTQSVRRFASFNASSELPADTEDAILFWINKVCVTVQKHLEKNQDTLIEGGETSQKVRIKSNKAPRESISVPIMESLLQDMGDGCSMATLISFYCPQILHIEDVCLKSNVGIADSLYNLRLIRSFCDRHLPMKTCHFTYEDLLYTNQNIRDNLVMMVAEIFFWFEIKKLPIVTGGGFTPVSDNGDGPQQRAQSAHVPSIPISNVTKQSFNRVKTDSELRSSSTPDIHRMSTSLPPRMPLLHRRQQQHHAHFHDDQKLSTNHAGVHRTNSLTSHDIRQGDPTSQSVLAWQEKSAPPAYQPGIGDGGPHSGSSGNLLGNVSIDSDMNASFSSGSIDLGELDHSPLHSARSQFDQTDSAAGGGQGTGMPKPVQKTPHPGMAEQLELESVTSGADYSLSQSQQQSARLSQSQQQSARLSQSQQQSRQLSHSQQQSGRLESTEPSLEGSVDPSLPDRREPLMPARLKPAKEKTNNHSKEEERDESPKKRGGAVKKKVEIDPSSTVIQDVQSENGEEEFYDCEDEVITPEPQPQSPKKFDAFFIRGSVSDSMQSGMMTDRSDVTVAESYVIDKVKTPEAARALGLPIIDNNSGEMSSPGQRLSREGSVASSKSSGDFSDHESHKIHSDHKTRETRDNPHKSGGVKFDVKTDLTNPSAYIIQKPIIMNRQTKGSEGGKMATNFAQIKHLKDLGQVDNSGFVYMQHGRDDDDRKSSLKDTFQRKQAEKKTTFAPLPNQTTWQNTHNSANQNSAEDSNATQNGSASQELLKLKLKLEEKRRAIERKKHSQELQQQKMRQRLGKAAFLHVVSKTKEEGSVPDSVPKTVAEIPSRMTTSDSELAGQSSGFGNSRMTSSSPLKSPAHQKVPRPFSRDDIQQTIENVRKKWFQTDGQDGSDMPEHEEQDNMPYEDPAQDDIEAPDGQITPRPVFDRRSASVERITSLADQTEIGSPRSDPSPQMSPYGRRSVSVERTDPRYNNTGSPLNNKSTDYGRRSTSVERTAAPRSTPRRQSADDKPESYEEYNSSLDQLNKSLTDLQGEIMKLSLKQKQAGVDPQQRSRSKSPPHVLEVKQKNLPDRSVEEEVRQSRSSQPAHSQSRSASEPRQLPPEPEPEGQLGGYQSHTLPRQPGYHQGAGQVPQFMSQSAGPTGPVYGSPSQYVQPVQAQGYGNSYILGPPTPGQMQPHPHMQYQQSPPQGYPAGTVYPGQPYMVSPQTQQYGVVYTSPHYQPIPPSAAGTYTTSVLPQQMPLSQPPLFDPNTQHAYPPQQPYPHHPDYTASRAENSSPPQHQTVSSSNQSNSKHYNQQTSSSVNNTPDKNRNRTHSEERKFETNRANDSGVETQYDEGDKSGGFFVSFNESSPRRNKPQLSDKKKPDSQLAGGDAQRNLSDSEKYGSSVIADFAHKAADQQSSRSTGSDGGNQSINSGQEVEQEENQPAEAVGFVIGQDDSALDQSAEEEMLKKKERIEKMRQKRQEEQEKKKQKLEQEAQKKRETERLKQEESERRKSEEKARREQIFKQYLQKKEDDEEGKPEKTNKKPRPKSMFVRLGKDAHDDMDSTRGSAEDVSTRSGEKAMAYFFSPAPVRRQRSFAARGNTKPWKHKPAQTYSQRHKMRKAVSCNTLNSNGDKSLAYGGLTHRRPPSPDLYKLRKGQRSNEGSEAGSVQSDYSGPKLFVKPSAKSNRHIIINAISHCCLAGTVNTDLKNKVLEEIAKSSAKHFIILFRDTGCGFRSLYGFDPDTEQCGKIMGTGPRLITNDMVEKYYKYNSGAKSFSQVSSTKHISVSIDAIVLQNSVWKANKAPSKGFR